MATLNAHGSFYRIQDNITRTQKSLGDNMQRLSSGLKNISAGSRPGDVAVVNSMSLASRLWNMVKQMLKLVLLRLKWRLPTYHACQTL
tara:strand:+ start:270 stop:533 length:264 start_codon:yes stop_codon:yes gene_type:complete